MIRSLMLSLATLALLAAPVLAQDGMDGKDGKDGKDGTPAVAAGMTEEQAVAFMGEIKGQVGKQSIPDSINTAKQLLNVWISPNVSDATKKPVPKHLEKLAKNKDVTVAMTAIENLGKLKDPAGAKAVLGILAKTLKAKEPSVDVYGACFRALKELADESKGTIKALTKYLKYKEDDVIGKSLDAISGYKKAPGPLRKELLEECIKNTEGTYNAAQASGNTNQRRKWNIIQTSAMTAMNTLSGQRFKTPQDARRWYNDNKKNKALWK